MEQAEAFVLDQISLAQRSLIPGTLKTAYDAAALVVKDEPIFNVPSALDNRGRIIQWSVDLAFQRLVTAGKWPFRCEWREFNLTGRYLEILPSHCSITISQTADPTKQPRDAKFRREQQYVVLCLPSQPYVLLRLPPCLVGLPTPPTVCRVLTRRAAIPGLVIVGLEEPLAAFQKTAPLPRRPPGALP